MSMRLPVIACHSGGVPEIIEHGRNGWLVEPRSASAVSEAIALLMADPERRRCLGERARDTVRDRFAPTQQSDSVSQIYHRLAEKR
jgi:glycosyltransferase involved in cell wall biosynthesis